MVRGLRPLAWSLSLHDRSNAASSWVSLVIVCSFAHWDGLSGGGTLACLSALHQRAARVALIGAANVMPGPQITEVQVRGP